MSTVATLVVRVAGDLKDVDKAFAGLESAGKGLERSYAGLGATLSALGGNLTKGIGSAFSSLQTTAGSALSAVQTSLGNVGSAVTPLTSTILPKLTGAISGIGAAFGPLSAIAAPVLGGLAGGLTAVAGVATGVVVGLVALAKSAADAGDKLLVLSQQSGISVENLSRFQYVEQQTDASVDKIVGSIQKLGVNLANGSKEASKAIEGIGLSLAKVRTLKPEEAFIQIVDGLGKIPDAGKRAAAGAAIFGKGWHDVSQLASEDLRGLMTEADTFGGTISKELAIAGDRFNDTLGQMSRMFEGLKLTIGQGVLPVLETMVKLFQRELLAALRATGITAANTQDTFTHLAIAIAQGVALVARAASDMLSSLADPTLLATLNGLLQAGRAFAILKTPALGGGTGGVAQALIAGFADFDPSKFVSAASTMQEALANVRQGADRFIRDLPKQTAAAKAAWKAQADAMRDTAAASGTFGAATGHVDDAMKKLIDTLSSTAAGEAATKLMDAFKKMGDTGVKVTREGAVQIKDALDKWFDALHSTGQKIPEEAQKIWLAVLPPPRFEHQWLNAVTKLRAPSLPVPLIAAQLQGGWDAIVRAVKFETLPQQAEQAFRNAKWGALLADWSTQLVGTVNRTVADMLTGIRTFEDGFKDIWRGIQQFGSSIINEVLVEITKPLVEGMENTIKNIDWDNLGKQGAKQGAIAGALVGASVGLAMTQAFGAEAGLIAGMVSGLATGLVTGGLTAGLIGLGVGAGTAILASIKAEEQRRDALRASRQELVAQFGSIKNLQAAYERLGLLRFDDLMNSESVDTFTYAVNELNQALTAERIAVEKLGKGLESMAVSGTLLTRNMAIEMKKLSDVPGGTESIFAFMQQQAAAAGKGLDTFLSNTTVKTKEGAAAIGGSLAALYDELLRQGVKPSQAFAQLEPAIFKLQEQLAKAGIAAPAAFQPLADLAKLSADTMAGPMLDAMNGLGEGLTAMHNLGLLNQESFSGFAAEALAGFKAMELQGKGGIVAVQGMRGPLQKLWELQKDFGYTVTEDEQKLLSFAEAGGVIGDKFRPAADRMVSAVEKLVERLDKFLTKISEMPAVTKPAAQGVENELNKIQPKPIEIKYKFTPENELPSGGSGGDYTAHPNAAFGVPALAKGAIVRTPTLAVIGERGPEAVIPLPRDFGSETELTLLLDSEVLTRAVLRKQGRVMRAYGLAR